MLALVQLRATADLGANLANAARLVRQAATQGGAKFICLPEAFDYINDHQQAMNVAQPVHGPRTAIFTALARELRVWISLGGMHEQSMNDENKQYNAHVVINDLGEVCSVYRKIHLFDALVDNGFRESTTTLPGNQVVVVRNTPIGTVGLTVCYDLRFPALFSRLRDEGCDVILVPAAFTMATGEAGHWHTLLRARAIENQVYIAAAAQAGAHNATRSSYGHSLLIDPFGTVLFDLGGSKHENVWRAAPISLDRIQQVRAQMPVQEHRHRAKY